MVGSVSTNLVAQAFAGVQKNKGTGDSQNLPAALKTNKSAKQAIMEQLEQTANQGKNLMQLSSSTSALSSAPDSNLPRGSLVDILV